MNILLHGAINGSNFGDCIFADLFYTSLKKSFPNYNIWFYDKPPYGISDFLRNQINYHYIMREQDYKDVDLFVFISGGYFGEDDRSLRDSVVRYLRYIKIGKKYAKCGTPIVGIGLEVGPIHYRFLRRDIRFILNHCSLLTVRNSESYDYCKNNLRISDLKLTADTAIQIGKKDLSDFNCLNELVDGNKKNIFLHIPTSGLNDMNFTKNVLMPVIRFCKNNPNYSLIYGLDNLEFHDISSDIENLFKQEQIYAHHYIYTSYWEMCSLLSKVDIIITTKLHVGIIGASYGKSVISIPKHKYKTERFYKSIDEKCRCVSYYKLTPEVMSGLLNKYYDKKIELPEDKYLQSKSNIENLVDKIKTIENLSHK